MTLAEQFHQLGYEKGFQKGFQEGLEQARKKRFQEAIEAGRQKALEKATMNLLKADYDRQLISEITGLDLAVILGLKAKLEQQQ